MWSVVAPSISSAHHSVAGFFSPDISIEIEGVVAATLWRNPHTEFQVEVTEPSGEVTEWRVETGALAVLRARGVDREFLRVGDRIKVMGDESLRGQPEVFARNLLLSNGSEVLLTVGSTTYFSLAGEGQVLEPTYDDDTERAARANADGIFRVWSSNLDEIPHSGSRMFNGNYPLTQEALAKRLEWDLSDVVLLGCTEWRMPDLMGNPLPMEFVRQGDDILLRFEEDDNERLIYMNADPSAVPGGHTLLGYSTGRWEGESLIVATTNLEASILDSQGTPLSSAIELIEHFTPSSGGSRLEYRLRMTDPNTFTESFEVERHWIWRPEIVVGRYACEEEQQFR